MNFSPRKLPIEAASEMRNCPISSVQPFALMLAPVYVFMPRNQKFVALKGPLDFFTPAELERVASFEMFYLPSFVDLALEFRAAARRMKAILQWVPAKLEPASFEISDAGLRLVAPLWSAQGTIEPFFVAIFSGELCDQLPSELLLEARDLDIRQFEHAIFTSAFATFLALHLGFTNLAFLSRLRTAVFERQIRGVKLPFLAPEISELAELAGECALLQELSQAYFAGRPERVSQKLSARLVRVKAELGQPEGSTWSPSIYGEKGFDSG